MRKKRLFIIIRAAFLTAAVFILCSGISFAQLGSFINNDAVNAPEGAINVTLERDANNPQAPTRYEGSPTDIMNNGDGQFSYHQISPDNWCTKITSNGVNTSGAFTGYVGVGRDTGDVYFSVDLAFSEVNSTTSLFIWGRDDESATQTMRVLYFTSGGLMKSDTTDGLVSENYELLKNYPKSDKLNDSSWYRIKMIMHMNTKTFDMYVNDMLIREGAAFINSNLTSVTGFRITNTYAAGKQSTIYADNYYLAYNPLFNDSLLHGAYCLWENRPDAVVRRVPIYVDRYDMNIYPVYKNETFYIPLRFIADCYHADTVYNDNDKSVTVNYGETESVLMLGSGELTVNGEAVTISASPITVDGRVLIPMEAAAKILNTNAYYNGGRIMFTDYNNVSETDFMIIFEKMEEKL
ncbi:MAG: copper amine oxidase N-terminal domain-containing protein [Clostridia bacterium]|nr:copper amine oxidase N-terminal domain-containing protein [Clostridia bacterium]